MVSYIGVAFLVPIGQETPIVDEPIFAKSAFEFAETGSIAISNLSAPNAIFDTVWGGLFVQAFGESYGALRLSSIVLTALSAPFVYVLCRDVGGGRDASLLGTSAYLYAPLAMSIGFTFHTDPHALALITISVGAFGRFLSSGSYHWLVAASIMSSLGFLSRPQVLVVVVAGLLVIFFGQHDSRWKEMAAFLALPLVVGVAHAFWTQATGEPFLRELSRESLLSRSPIDVAVLTAKLVVSTPLYLGLFALPLFPILQAKRRAKLRLPPIRTGVALTFLFTLGVGLAIVGVPLFGSQTWLNEAGLGAVDTSLLGSRPDLLGHGWSVALRFALFVVAFAVFLAANRRQSSTTPGLKPFLNWLILGFALAGLASSLALQGMIFDRYLLPLLPLVLALGVSGAHVTSWRLALSASLVAGLAVFSIVSMRDAFTVYEAVHDVADRYVASGVPATEFDGGASWSAAKFGVNEEIEDSIDRKAPYWMRFYADESDPSMGIALHPLPNSTVVDHFSVGSVLHRSGIDIYVVSRPSFEPYFQPWDY